MFALIQTFKNVLRIFFHRLTFFVIALNFTSNICSLVINHGDKTVSKLYCNNLTNTRLLFMRALESRLLALRSSEIHPPTLASVLPRIALQRSFSGCRSGRRDPHRFISCLLQKTVLPMKSILSKTKILAYLQKTCPNNICDIEYWDLNEKNAVLYQKRAELQTRQQ